MRYLRLGLACISLALSLLATAALAQEKRFTLAAPEVLAQSGVLKFILPRFSLKTGVRITIVSPDAPHDAAFGAQGTPVFQGEELWAFSAGPSPHAARFLDWLTSDVGKRTIDSFKVDGAAPFSSDVVVQVSQEVAAPEGDTLLGEAVSLERCGRCHVVNHKNRMKAIGSTPSFAVLRTFGDWRDRFETFYVLKPHGAFTQIAEVTPPFPETSPSPIVPIELTLDELDAVVAYVASIAPADLGAPIKAQ